MASLDGEEPVERKVQLTGGSTYTVSLPKDWARDQGIEPGCAVTLYSRDDRLVMTRGEDGRDSRQIATIEADDFEPGHLGRCVRAAYVTGAPEIRIRGGIEAEQRLAVEDATGGLVGFEVDRQSSDGLVVRSMLDASDLSLAQTLVQMKDIGLSMHEHAIEAVVASEGEAARTVASQDDAVDRLLALVSRQFQRSLTDAGGVDRPTAFAHYSAARQLERVADHAEKIAGVARRVEQEPPEDVAERLTTLGGRTRSLVERAVAALLAGDGEATVGEVASDAEALLGEIGDLDRDLYERHLDDGYHLGIVLDSLVRTTEYGVNVTESALERAVRDADA
ncbi:PhoU domain-containing protein [Halobacteriales archaeon Cl-PHB]